MVFRYRSRCPAAGPATAHRTWNHPGRVPRHQAAPGRTRGRRWRYAVRSRSAGPVASNPRDHQSCSGVRISVSSTSHFGSRPPRGARHDLPAGEGEPVDAPPLAYRPPAGRGAAVLAERAARVGPLLPVLHAPAAAVLVVGRPRLPSRRRSNWRTTGSPDSRCSAASAASNLVHGSDQQGCFPGSGREEPSGIRVISGARQLAQPLGIGPGFVRAGFCASVTCPDFAPEPLPQAPEEDP